MQDDAARGDEAEEQRTTTMRPVQGDDALVDTRNEVHMSSEGLQGKESGSAAVNDSREVDASASTSAGATEAHATTTTTATDDRDEGRKNGDQVTAESTSDNAAAPPATPAPTTSTETTSTETQGKPPIASEASTMDASVNEASTVAAPSIHDESVTMGSATTTIIEPGAALRPPPPAGSSATPPPPSSSPAPATKKFQSSLAVNKKFLEKAGDKAKASPEVKPTLVRSTPSPAPTTATTSHPRLLTGKISLTMGNASSSSTGANVNSSSSTSGGATGGSGGAGNAPSTTWTKPAAPASLPTPSPGLTSEDRAFGGAARRGFGPGPGASSRSDAPWTRGSGRSGHGEFSFGAGDFPTAAEAANAKAARAQQILEQMQSRDRAIQARAAAAAAANAHLLEGLDAFRGVHLDPNASHWDEMGDEDDNFLDDTIEFGDGTQYKISEVAAQKEKEAAENELREPSREEMGKLEAPLRPGEKIEEPSRAERFKDDFDRSYRRESSSTMGSKSLFNARDGKLEPTRAPPSGSSRRMSNDHDRGARSMISPRLEKASLPPTTAWGRSSAVPAPMPRRPSVNAGDRQVPPHLAAHAPPAQPARSNILSPPRAKESPLSPAPSAAATVVVATVATAPLAPPSVAEEVEDLETRQAREMHAAAERARIRRQEEERERLAQAERARKKAQELEEKMKAAEEAKKAKEAPVAAAAAPKVNGATSPPPVANESWRKPPPPPPTKPSLAPAPTPVAKQEPIRILAREANAAKVASLARRPATSAAPSTPASVAAPRGALESQDRAWRRADVPPARPAQPTTGYRQPPPHLQVQPATRGEQPVLSERKISASAGAATTAPKLAPAPELKAGPAKALLPPMSVSIAANDQILSTSPRRGAGGKGQQRDTAQFDDLMSRVKSAMSPPSTTKESATTTQDAPETVSTGSTSPKAAKPVIKLPSTSKTAGIKATSPAASASVPAAAPARGRSEAKNVVPAAPKPAFEPREPCPMFERTRSARSPSPGPAWRLYPVRVAPHPTPRRPPPKRQVAAFYNPSQPLRVALLTWNPPLQGLIPRRLSRDDLLHPKKYFKGVLQSSVVVPHHRIERKTEIEIVIVDRTKPKPSASATPNGAQDLSRTGTPSTFERGRSTPLAATAPTTTVSAKERPADGDTWRRATPIKANGVSPSSQVDATTAPSTAALFDPATPQRVTPASSVASAHPQQQSVASSSFFRAKSPAAMNANDRSFMVTGELGGVEVEKTPRKSLAAPGADRTTPTSLEKAKASFEATTPSVLSSPSSGWPGSKAALSLSALDPTASSLWAAPPPGTTAHARSLSVPRVRQENSLEGLADDDYPAATIPTSLADLKTEDDVSPERVKTLQPEAAAAAAAAKTTPTPVPNNEPKLRAAAPSFSSFNTDSFASYSNVPGVAAAPPRFASMQRGGAAQASGGLNPYSPSISPHVYSPQPSPAHTLSAYAQPLYSPAQQYASYAPLQHHQPARVSYAPTAASLYATTTGGQGEYGTTTMTQQQQQQAYYRAQAAAAALAQQQHGIGGAGVTNPALLASGYGAGAYAATSSAATTSGAYGAVGGGMNRHASHGSLGSTSTVSYGSSAGGAAAAAAVHQRASSAHAPIARGGGGVEYGGNGGGVGASSYRREHHAPSGLAPSSPYRGGATSSTTPSYSTGTTMVPPTTASYLSGPSPVMIAQHAHHLVPSGSVGSAFAAARGAYGGGASMGRGGGGAAAGATPTYRPQW